MTDILEAIFNCDLKSLKTLLHDGKRVNNEIPGTEGCSPLHLVVGIQNVSGKDAVLSYLIQAGADPNARSYDDLTPVHIASMWNNCAELEKLLQYGGNPWLTDNENKNSFDLAADNKAYEAFQLLNKYLADGKLDFRDYAKRPNRPLKSERKNLCDTITNNTAYVSANENFPMYFSATDDESIDCFLNVSRILKKSFTKSPIAQQQKVQKNLTSKVRTKRALSKMLFNTLAEAGDASANSKENTREDHNNAAIFSTDDTESCDFGGNETFGSVSENSNTILYSDNESGIVLMEKSCCDSDRSSLKRRYTPAKCDITFSDWKSCRSGSSLFSFVSECATHTSILFDVPSECTRLNNSELYQELKRLGDHPGPIMDSTRDVYLLRLAKLQMGCNVSCNLPVPKYCEEVYKFLDGKLDMNHVQSLVSLMTTNFNSPNPNENWREGNQRSCFNYFLLDPRITLNLPTRLKQFTFEKAFATFLDSLFYVGKGTKNRPYSHLVEAAKAMHSSEKKNDKISHILDIWNSGLGVISLHCFNNSVPVEAYTQEACIIEAVGLENLTNKKNGDFYGIASKWKRSWKRQVGVELLHKALQIFIAEGEKQILPKDIKTK